MTDRHILIKLMKRQARRVKYLSEHRDHCYSEHEENDKYKRDELTRNNGALHAFALTLANMVLELKIE